MDIYLCFCAARIFQLSHARDTSIPICLLVFTFDFCLKGLTKISESLNDLVKPDKLDGRYIPNCRSYCLLLSPLLLLSILDEELQRFQNEGLPKDRETSNGSDICKMALQ